MPEQNYRPSEHLTSPRAHVYRRIMGAIVAAKRRFTVRLRSEDVHATLSTEGAAADIAMIADVLSSPTGWGTCVPIRHQPHHHGRGLPADTFPLPADSSRRGGQAGAGHL